MMRVPFSCLALLCFTGCGSPSHTSAPESDWSGAGVYSRVDTTAAGELILIQSLTVKAPVDVVWDAYTTVDGWTAWSTPVAEIDLRAGGTIRTNYQIDGQIGDANTNTLYIRNYVPRALLTLQAEITGAWPEFMKEEADNLYNIVHFEQIDASSTRIASYGTGYKDDDRFGALMQFFINGNEETLERLRDYVESGTRATFDQYQQ